MEKSPTNLNIPSQAPNKSPAAKNNPDQSRWLKLALCIIILLAAAWLVVDHVMANKQLSAVGSTQNQGNGLMQVLGGPGGGGAPPDGGGGPPPDDMGGGAPAGK